MIRKKNRFQVNQIQKSGKIAAFTLRELSKAAKPGVSTSELDHLASRLITARGGKPSFLGYRGYKYSTCISINDEVVHGIPSARKIVKGDIVSIDVGVNLGGYFSDTAVTIMIGSAAGDVKRLVSGTKESLLAALSIIKPGIKIGDIEKKTGTVLKEKGISPVTALSGHGVGFAVHEEPSIKSDGESGSGEVLEEGMVLAIEPMGSLGTGKVKTSADGWTVKTLEGAMSAHFEHTVAVTKSGHKILTER